MFEKKKFGILGIKDLKYKLRETEKDRARMRRSGIREMNENKQVTHWNNFRLFSNAPGS